MILWSNSMNENLNSTLGMKLLLKIIIISIFSTATVYGSHTKEAQ